MSLRAAIIGAGQITRLAHLPGYVRADAQVVALCSRPGPNLDRLADENKIERRYDDWQRMLGDGGFDVVSICTPPALHCMMAVECARRSLHVLVEKPMALTPGDCARMIEAADQAHVILMIAHNQRFIAHHQQVKTLLASGQLGRPYLIHAVFGHAGPEKWSPTQDWYFNPDQAGHGVLADLGVHMFDLIAWLLDEPIIEVGALGQTFEKPTPASDSIVCTLRLSGEALATVQVSWAFHAGWENSLTIRCERGVIRVPTDAAEPVVVMREDDGEMRTQIITSEQGDPAGWYGTVAAFCDAVRSGKPSPIPGADGKAAVKAIQAAYDSLTRHQIVRLGETNIEA